MKIKFALSKKVDAAGLQELLLSAKVRQGDKITTMRAKSEIKINSSYFNPDCGVEINKRRLIAPDVKKYHVEALKRINDILTAVAAAEPTEKDAHDNLPSDWLKDVVSRYLHPEKYLTQEERERTKTVYDFADDYLRERQMSVETRKAFEVVMREVARYEGFIRATDKKRKDFTFDVHTIDRDVIEDIRDYVRNEKSLSEQYPTVFCRLLQDYPASLKPGVGTIKERGENAVIKFSKMLKAFLNWLYDTGRTHNRPFEGVKFGAEKYGTPYYITIEERDKIASTPMPDKQLETQRDVFVFQCLIGCRVSDLLKLTAANIQNNILEYTPRKTKNEGDTPTVARVPLHPKAVELINKYKGVDSKGRLFPFISAQKYNDDIKKVFTVAGITRNVEIRDSLTGETILRPINEVASSHIARRTFVGNLYQRVQDPNLIGKMSGHVEGSAAFARYRKIEDETLKNIIDLI